MGYELGTIALILCVLAAWIKVFLINPYRGARHIANIVSSTADVEEKENSKEVLKDVGNSTINFLGFMGSCIGMAFLSLPIALLRLPYFVNLILAIGAVGLLMLSYSYFQNRS
jgi:hypothetical protein